MQNSEKSPEVLQPACEINASSRHADNTTPIHWLPVEVLEYLFTFLDVKQRIRLNEVCTKWRHVNTIRPWTWPPTLTLEGIKPKHEACGTTSSPHSDDEHHLNVKMFTAILPQCGSVLKQLTVEVNVKACRYCPSVLQVIGKHCPNIVKLTLVNVPIDVQGIKHLGWNCKDLKVLILNRYELIREKEFGALIRSCSVLETLEVTTENYDVSEYCFRFISPLLKTLRLDVRERQLDSRYRFHYLTRRCTTLQELTLCARNDFTADERRRLVKVFSRLSNTLKTLGLQCTAWHGLAPVLPDLQKLFLSGCTNVSEYFCQQLARNCVSICDLDLSYTDVTDKGVALLANLPKLGVLNISFAKNIRGRSLEVLFKHGHLNKLFAAHLDVSAVPGTAFRALPTCCPDLEVLDVCHTKTVSNELIAAFRIAVGFGYINRLVRINVTGTDVTRDVLTCELLQIAHSDCDKVAKGYKFGKMVFSEIS